MTKTINNLKELFSDEELAYFEAVAPTPDDYSGSRNGPSRRDLTDETNPNLSPKQKKIARLAGDKEKIDAEDLTTLRTGKKITEQSKYKVKKGDTLWDLAKQNNTTVDAIVKSSGIKNANKLSIGQEIVIPGKQEATPIRTPADSLQNGELIKRPVYMSTVDTGDRLVSVPADPLAAPITPPVPMPRRADRMPGVDQPKTDLITRTVKTLDVNPDGTVITQPSSNKALPKPEPLAFEIDKKQTETPAVADKMNTNYWKQFSTGMFPGSGLDVGSRIIPGADVAQKSPKISNSELANVDAERADRIAYETEKEKKASEKLDNYVKKPKATNLPIDNPLVGFDLGKYGRTRNESTMEENSQITEARGRPPKEDSLGANELHMNAKRAADNMMNITHKFANGERVKMTKGMGVAFLNRHTAARTSDDKDALLNYAHQSPETFEHVSKGGSIPKAEKAGIKLGSMKAK